MRKVKVQITMPQEVYDAMKMDMEQNFMSASSWILKAALAELERKKTSSVKKLIKLNV